MRARISSAGGAGSDRMQVEHGGPRRAGGGSWPARCARRITPAAPLPSCLAPQPCYLLPGCRLLAAASTVPAAAACAPAAATALPPRAAPQAAPPSHLTDRELHHTSGEGGQAGARVRGAAGGWRWAGRPGRSMGGAGPCQPGHRPAAIGPRPRAWPAGPRSRAWLHGAPAPAAGVQGIRTFTMVARTLCHAANRGEGGVGSHTGCGGGAEALGGTQVNVPWGRRGRCWRRRGLGGRTGPAQHPPSRLMHDPGWNSRYRAPNQHRSHSERRWQPIACAGAGR